MICYTVVAVIGLNALGAFASNGAQAFTWLVISAVTFFLPYGLMVAELGSTFPQEGGIYEWCKLAGGRLYAAFAATFYWIIISLRHGKWISTVGFFVNLALLGIFLILVGIFVVSDSGHGSQLAVTDLVP